ncbi:MAG: CoB--CoM heterodisulfide reductase iron-sulfur subunit B family protein [Candidatus Thermoplasmatota archaeon]|nr:CoB--CoM heterodisulfide reductase iron-sulfur subunit B family protein [Candidatus Thermoplasmatota archaeon]
MKYVLFLGCTIPVRAHNYEMASREVAKKLEIDFVDVPEFSCCGFPVKSTNEETSLMIAARNLAIAGEKGEAICTLCNACTSVLTEANKVLTEKKELRAKINKELSKIGREFKPGVKIKHFARILYEDVGLETIQKKIKKNLSTLSISVHYGCHYLRPSDLYDNFDDAENPSSLENLVAVTGAAVVDYKNKLECCGGAILGVEENIALSMAKQKLDNVTANKVDALVTICPFCSIMYEDNQKKIESKFNVIYGLPVLYYPQVLGLALGIDQKNLGFRLNKVKPTALLEKVGVTL